MKWFDSYFLVFPNISPTSVMVVTLTVTHKHACGFREGIKLINNNQGYIHNFHHNFHLHKFIIWLDDLYESFISMSFFFPMAQ